VNLVGKGHGEERSIRKMKDTAGYGKKRTQKQAPVRRLVQSGRRTTTN